MRTCCVYFPWYCPILTFRARGNATKAYRYDIVQHFVTAAPPEHDDLTFLRVAKIRLERHQFRVSRTDLPSELQASPRNRIALVNEYPASAAMVFKRKKDMLLDDIIDASRVDPRESVAITLSVNPHAYSRVAAFTLCIEPQMDGRLHLHMILYGSTYTPGLLFLAHTSPTRLIPGYSSYETTGREGACEVPHLADFQLNGTFIFSNWQENARVCQLIGMGIVARVRRASTAG
eukprot:GHVR01136924.1.p1 GENE.GHVR01136924.1~~GHVR01136924.1.p1  ORF type:complete len:233 (-),score=-1.11 GHVR01136924.1:53-751(-)